MPSLRHFDRNIVLVVILCSLPAIAAPERTEVTAKFRIVNDYMIIVPVTINGSGPYDFLLDTGSNNTMLDQKLADELALRRGDEAIVGRVWGSVTSSVVYAESLSIGGAMVAGKDLTLFCVAKISGLPSKVRGLLGEDFLEKFDVLIDYDHQAIRLEPGPGSMAEMLKGEHVPIELSGMQAGEQRYRRLVITGRVRDLGEGSISLLLDSGSRQLILFRDDLGMGAERRTFVDSSRPVSSNVTVKTRTVRNLMLGKKAAINEIMVVALGAEQRPDVDGLIPTSLFHSIFISHQGKFVILNPSFSKGLR